MKKFNNKTFTCAVIEWAESVDCGCGHEITDAYCRLRPMFKQLADSILNCKLKSWSVPLDMCFKDTDSVIEDCVTLCFQKAHRFNPNKGMAFNYYTTIMLSHMRQIYMASKRKERKQNEELLVR